MSKSIRYKLLSGELIVILLIIFVSAWSITNFVRLSNSLEKILVENYKSVLAAENMIGSIERQDSSVLYYILGESEEGQKLFDKYQGEFMIWFGREKDNITVPGEKELVDEIDMGYANYLSGFEEVKKIYNSSGSEAAADYYYNRLLPQFMSIRIFCQDLLEMNHKTITDRNSDTEKVAGKAIWSTLIISVLSVLFGLLWNVYISGVVVSPILKLTEKVKSIAKGDLNESIDIKTNDEIGVLAMEFNKMTRQIHEYQDKNIDKLVMERKKSETIVREIYDGVIVADWESKITLVNKAAETILNKGESELLGRHFLEVIKDDEIYKILKDKMEGKIEEDDNETITISRLVHDVKKYFTVRASRIEGKDGKLEGVVLLLGDVTHFKELDEMKSDFVSIVSHEFRTPLTSIQMGVGLLKESNLLMEGTKASELLNVIDEDSKRLNRLVSELLDLTRIESGKISMEFKPVDLDSIIDKAIKAFEIQANEKGITLEKENDGTANVKVIADSEKIIWVLVNLISNAFRYTPSGGSIKVSIENESNKAFVVVKDTGIGIPKKYHESIFEKFTQVKNDGVTAGGAGLGLAISKDIIKAHKGRIWVESEEGHGSKFIFTLTIAN